MRILALSVSLAMLTACINGNWKSKDPLPVGCDEGNEFEYFLDADRDGWGEPYAFVGGSFVTATSVPGCTAAEAAAAMAELLGEDEVAVAANNRDCVDDFLLDDRAADITGRIGSICPDQLVTNTAGDTWFTPLSAAGVEIVIVHDEPVPNDADLTPLTWGDAAADACGPWGWGGGVLRVDNEEASGSLLSLVGQPNAILDALTNALPADIGNYAGFVGVVSHELAAGSLSEGWYWESIDASGTPSYTSTNTAELTSALPYCGGEEPDPLTYSRLAAVYNGSSWCLGLPVDANSTPPRYETRFGHFICQRAIPDGSSYAGRSDYGLDE